MLPDRTMIITFHLMDSITKSLVEGDVLLAMVITLAMYLINHDLFN